MPRRLILALALAATTAHPVHAFRHLAVGQDLTPAALTSPAGDAVVLGAGSRAVVYLLWASWSPRSLAALGDFERLFEAHRGQGLRVVAVNVDRENPEVRDLDHIAVVLRDTGVSYPAAVDRGLTLYEAWGTNAVPSAVLTDAAGKIIDVLDGYPPEGSEVFRAAVLAALAQRPAAADPSSGEELAFRQDTAAAAAR